MDNMEIAKNVSNSPEPKPANPAEGSGERLFTQDDVNRIVQERLSRVKTDSAPQFADKEKELAQREARLNCREFLEETKYPTALLEILDTTDFEKFKTTVNLMAEKLPNAFARPTGFRTNIGLPLQSPSGGGIDPVARAFMPGADCKPNPNR